ncbi:MAG: thiamine-phosphate kinase [Phycisphaerales bacterium]|nr:thiamine-phosphate kinase [Phycisphaerales bacterium]
MHEEALLQHIYARSKDIAGDVLVGPGDDCSVVRIGSAQVLLTTDQLVEHRHFAADLPIDRIAHKAVARSVSDIAAMGGAPSCALATACLPNGYLHADALFDAMHRAAAAMQCPLVGGDIAIHDGPIVLTVTAIGTPHPTRGPVLRTGARPGDQVWVTGKLGGSLASGRHAAFTPRVTEAQRLCDQLGEDLHAMIDLSDGAGRDSGRIASASGCAIELDETALPMHAGVTDWRCALGDGEDYELLFTTAPSVQVASVKATPIGCCVPGEGCWLINRAGARHDVTTLGWNHGA